MLRKSLKLKRKQLKEKRMASESFLLFIYINLLSCEKGMFKNISTPVKSENERTRKRKIGRLKEADLHT